MMALKSNSPPPKNLFYLLQRKLFKNDKNCFLFHLESSFHFQDLSISVLTFWSSRKNGLVGNVRLILKFKTSQPD